MCSHSAEFSGQHKIILFGGIGNERYLEPDITILEMGKNYNNNFILRSNRCKC